MIIQKNHSKESGKQNATIVNQLTTEKENWIKYSKKMDNKATTLKKSRKLQMVVTSQSCLGRLWHVACISAKLSETQFETVNQNQKCGPWSYTVECQTWP